MSHYRQCRRARGLARRYRYDWLMMRHDERYIAHLRRQHARDVARDTASKNMGKLLCTYMRCADKAHARLFGGAR